MGDYRLTPVLTTPDLVRGKVRPASLSGCLGNSLGRGGCRLSRLKVDIMEASPQFHTLYVCVVYCFRQDHNKLTWMDSEQRRDTTTHKRITWLQRTFQHKFLLNCVLCTYVHTQYISVHTHTHTKWSRDQLQKQFKDCRQEISLIQ